MKKLISHYIKAILWIPIILWLSFQDFLENVKIYYKNTHFLKTEFYMFFLYLFRSPYRLCRVYTIDAPDDKVQKIYGETFLKTAEKLSFFADIKKDDIYYDIGCGRGRVVFWHAAFIGCRSIGIDINPVFIRRANWINSKAGLPAEFIKSNLLNIPMYDATVIYLYGSAFTEEGIQLVARKLQELASGTRIISISRRIDLFQTEQNMPFFILRNTMSVEYLWGETQAYLFERTKYS
ncbi:MAG: class I SAM-dependent methyltransferase [Pseudomonadota bacterium]